MLRIRIRHTIRWSTNLTMFAEELDVEVDQEQGTIRETHTVSDIYNAWTWYSCVTSGKSCGVLYLGQGFFNKVNFFEVSRIDVKVSQNSV